MPSTLRVKRPRPSLTSPDLTLNLERTDKHFADTGPTQQVSVLFHHIDAPSWVTSWSNSAQQSELLSEMKN